MNEPLEASLETAHCLPPPYNPPYPKSGNERVKERLAMVERQIIARGDVRDPRVLEALRTVPRHAFIPEEHRSEAYQDHPVLIGHGQTISQPYMVGVMSECLRLQPGDKVLEIGGGCGYQAAVLAHLTPRVYSIEILEPLARMALTNLDAQGYSSVKFRNADGYEGWQEEAPFDAIVIPCATDEIPPPLWNQLAVGGRLVVPINRSPGLQHLYVLEKNPEGVRQVRGLMMVRFVPMTRKMMSVAN